ncbi:MAG TPA: hypothetical protein PLP19_16820 [bacterium]|mgnify:CR=1 FL=1|nr:hypothetical protein [bacterium]HPN45157.1 hypothetical protein [bacterium]
MKKFIILIICLSFVGFSYAANTNTNNQNGNNNTTNVTQVGSNVTTTNQTGDNGQITVQQDGANTATVDQVETASNTPVGQQIANVKQTGTGNVADVDQTETGGGGHSTNRATIEQDGTTNTAIQSTYAPGYNSGQTVNAYQQGAGNLSTQTISAGYTNSFEVDQIGDDNTATQTMSANHSHGYIYTVGDRNAATQNITGSNHGYSGGINIDQFGDDNTAGQTFSGSGLGHNQKGDILQDGNLNNASQISAGADNIANTYQLGDMNLATTTMTGNSDFADVDQIGNQNIATVDQVGNSHNASVQQYGRNYADVDQNGGNGNKAVVAQGASGAPVNNYYQPGYASDWKEGAYVVQTGNTNDALIDMNSNNGEAGIFQTGDLNQGSQELNSTYHRTNANKGYMAIEIKQIGNENVADQKTLASFGSYGIQKMLVFQEGNLNNANQLSKGGMASEINVKHVGNNNTGAASVDVAATGLASPLALSWTGPQAADVTNGVYSQFQDGRYSKAVIDVAGDGNKTTQAQQYTVWSTSGANEATLGIVGNDNASIQGQHGESNDSFINVSGSGNVIATSQAGDNHIADIDLLGSSDTNIAAIQQTGIGQSGTIMVNGVNNFSQIIQQP